LRVVSDSPRRWHLYVVNLEPQVGTKPGKRRPCLAIQPNEFGEGVLRSTVVLPLTSQVTAANAFPLRVRIPAGTGRLKRESDALVDQIISWDNNRFSEDLGEIPETIQDEVRRALTEFLDL
jgi:mRNA interferase MazF